METACNNLTFHVPFGYFIYDTKKTSTGTRADVNSATDKERIAVNVEETSDWE